MRLWYFGTAIPHTNSPTIESTKSSPLIAFLECYGFGYHAEHHEKPHLPWWKLLEIKSRD
jgi:beta-carotene/zeaxanthin 4-ketolase